MTYRNNFTLPAELLEQIAVEGFYVLPGLIRIIGNAAVQVERKNYLQVNPCELSSSAHHHPDLPIASCYSPILGNVPTD